LQSTGGDTEEEEEFTPAAAAAAVAGVSVAVIASALMTLLLVNGVVWRREPLSLSDMPCSSCSSCFGLLRSLLLFLLSSFELSTAGWVYE
jgi:hypothetical protein